MSVRGKRTSQPVLIQETDAPPTNGTNAPVVLHSWKVYLKPPFHYFWKFCMIYTPLVYLWHSVLLNVVLYCLRDNPDQTAMFHLNYFSHIGRCYVCVVTCSPSNDPLVLWPRIKPNFVSSPQKFSACIWNSAHTHVTLCCDVDVFNGVN